MSKSPAGQPEASAVLTTLESYATLLGQLGRERDAATVTARIERLRDMLGPSLTFLALAHLRYDLEPAKTLAHLQRSQRILEKHLVADHPVIGLHLAGFAAAHLALGERDRAIPHLQRAVAIAEQQYLPEHVPLALGLMAVVDAAWDRSDYRLAEWVAARRMVLEPLSR